MVRIFRTSHANILDPFARNARRSLMTERSERMSEEASFHRMLACARSLRFLTIPFFLCPFVHGFDGFEFYVGTCILIQTIHYLLPVPNSRTLLVETQPTVSSDIDKIPNL